MNKLFLIILAIAFISSMAFAAPGIPNQFYGTVTVNGAPAHGASITAKINSVEVASTASSNGAYGYYPNLFLITDPNGTNAGKKIEFYLSASKVAEATFENGASIQLNLSIGTSTSVCGDGTCNANENCGSCVADCGSCPPPIQPPTGGGGDSGSGGGGGGGGSSLTLAFSGNCIGKPVTLTAKLGAATPAENAVVTVMHNQKQVGSGNTDAQGKFSSTFNDLGKYVFTVKKGSVFVSTQTIELIDCDKNQASGTDLNAGSQGATQPAIETTTPCSEVNCNDSNPCTIDSCTKGVCVYNNAPEGTKCLEGFCSEGKCLTPSRQAGNGIAFTGFFGLGMTGNIIAGILILLGIVSFAFFLSKNKGKKK